jgi:hypothetical protein
LVRALLQAVLFRATTVPGCIVLIRAYHVITGL